MNEFRLGFHWRLLPEYDDVMAWDRRPHYWPIVRGIHRLPEVSPHEKLVMQSFGGFNMFSQENLLNKQSNDMWKNKC